MSLDQIDHNDLWLSDHRSIFSSDGNEQVISSFRQSQYEGFHWDCLTDRDYHQLTFGQDLDQSSHLSEWSMRFSSDRSDNESTTSSSSTHPHHHYQQQRTSWKDIKNRSCPELKTTTLYAVFQQRRRRTAEQHPCNFYQNFSDKSSTDSSTSSKKDPCQITLPRLTTFSELKTSNRSISNGDLRSPSVARRSIDRSLQTSFCQEDADGHSQRSVNRSKSIDQTLHHHAASASSTSNRSFPILLSLPDLSFLQHYATENPTRASSSVSSKTSKSIASDLFTIPKKTTRAVFYCSIPASKRGKALRSEETETLSSTCSSSENSTSSSGYSSSTPHPRPLKSCLKQKKLPELSSPTTVANVLAGGAAGDIFTLTQQTTDQRAHNDPRRYSMPIGPLPQPEPSAKHPTHCTVFEHDFRTKKTVSFCTQIVRRLITPAPSPEHRSKFFQDDCNLVPRESLTDSPPNEFCLESDDEDKCNGQPINFTQSTPEHLPRPLAMKYSNDRYLIDAFANTILHILEIKCNDPKSFYLNNTTNLELDRVLRHDLCPLLHDVFADGLRSNTGSIFAKKINVWRMIDLTTPNLGPFYDAKCKAQLASPSPGDPTERFNAFIYHLLNLQELAAWFTHFHNHRTLFQTYYDSSAFVLTHQDDELLERLTNQLEKLSPLAFRLKYSQRSVPRASASLLPKKLNVRVWLRDRKTQVKLSPKEFHSQSSNRRKSNSLLNSKR